MDDLEKQIEEAMQESANSDGYDNFYNIDSELQPEYIRRAYYKVILSMYSEGEVKELTNQSYLNGIKDIGLDKHNEWFDKNKKK